MLSSWVAALAVATIVLYVILSRSKTPNWPGGPTGLPLIGVLPDKKLQLHAQLAKYIPEFGDFFSFNLGWDKAIVLSSPTAIEELIVKKGQNFSSRPSTSTQAKIIAQDRLVQMEYGDMFRKHRKVAHRLLGMQNAMTFMPYQEYESRQTLRLLIEDPVSFYEEMQRYAASVTFSLLIGARFARPESQIPAGITWTVQNMFQSMRPGAWLADWLPILDYLPDSLAPWRAEAHSIFNSIIEFWGVFYTPVAERVKTGDSPDCFLKSFLESPDIDNFTESERRVLFSEILAAGSETTAITLQYFLKACLLYPDCIKHAQEELDRVVGPDRLPGWEDRENLPYIKAIVSEIHRWASVSPLSFYHATTNNDSYRGKEIPAKTTVLYNTYAVHYSDQYFPEPEKFLPERYLPRDDPRHMVNGAYLANHYGFGAGRRECPGKHVANASLYIVISRLLWTFNVELGNNPLPRNETVGDIPILGPVPFACDIKPRNEKAKEVALSAANIMDASLKVEDVSQYEEEMLRVLTKRKAQIRAT
ncbi:cytochrome P450 [Aspergillus spectabilis]